MPRLSALGLSAFALLAGAPVAASAQAGLLEWSAPPECPGPEAVGGAIARLIGESAARASVPRMRAEVVALEGGAFELTLRGESGTRTVRDESCAVVADAAALIAAMAVAPELHSDPSPPQPRAHGGQDRMSGGDGDHRGQDRMSGVDHSVLSPMSAEGLGVPPAGRARGVGWAIGVGAVGEMGALPWASVGPSVGVGLEVGALRIEGRALYLPPRRAGVDNHATAGGEVWLLAFGVRACAVALDEGVTAGPCGGVEAGAMHAVGDGVSTPESATAAWGGASAGGFLAVPIAEHLFVRADVEAAVPLNRPAFVIDGVEGEVHRPSAVSGRLSLGAEVRFR